MIRTITTSSESDLLATALAAAGLKFDLRHSSADHPYAGFRVIDEAGEPLAFTASLRSHALEFALHDALALEPSDATLQWFHDLTRAWGFGRLYHSLENGHYRASIGLHVTGDPPAPSAVLTTIDLLRHVRIALRDAVEAHRRPGWEDLGLDDLLVAAIPSADATAGVVRTVGLMREQGVALARADGDRFAGWLVDEGGGAYGIELFPSFGRFIHMRAVPEDVAVAVDSATLRRMNELNGRLAIGAVSMSRAGGKPFYVVGLPIAWTQVDEQLAGWLVERAWATTEMLRRAFK